MQKILQRAVFGVDRTVIAVGIGAAQAPLFIQLADGVNGHEPDNIHPQRGDPIQIRFDGTEGSLRGVTAHINFIDDAAPQGGIGIHCHGISSFLIGRRSPAPRPSAKLWSQERLSRRL